MILLTSLTLSLTVACVHGQMGGVGLGSGGFYGAQPMSGGFYSQPSPMMSRQSPLLSAGMGIRPMMGSQDDMLLQGNSPMQMSAYSPGMGLRGLPPGMGMSSPMGMGMSSPMGMGGMGSPMMNQMNPYDSMLARRASMLGMTGNSINQEGVSPYAFGGMSRPGSFDMGGQYPGGDREMFNEGGQNPQLTMGAMGLRGDGLSGVSYFPFARIRPGPGLMIVGHTKDQEEGVDQMPMFTPYNSNDTTSDAGLDTAFNQTDSLSLNGTTLGLSTVNNSTTTPIALTIGNSTTTSVIGGTTPPPCTHPVYMNRVFMSTALSMGLISANTSCVVLLDH